MEYNKLNSTEWKEGLMDVCGFLRIEMIQFLKDEGRYYGVVKSFLNNLRDSLEHQESKTTPEEIEKYGRVLNLIKSSLCNEFRRLGRRRLSPADRVIVMYKKILELIDEIQVDNFRYHREISTMKRVIGKLWGNIRNNGKNDSLFALSELIRSSVSKEASGRFRADVLDLYHIEHPKPKVKTLDGPETLLESNGKTKVIKEVSL